MCWAQRIQVVLLASIVSQLQGEQLDVRVLRTTLVSKSPTCLCLAPSRSELFACSEPEYAVDVVDTRTFKRTRRIAVPAPPLQCVPSRDERTLYIAAKG